MLELSLNILDICRNAAEAGARTLKVRMVRKGGVVRLSVEDDGCGMEEDVLARCTDPFFTTRKTRRTGLGLPLMKACAAGCGGEMRVESEKGRGTRVTVSMRYDHADCPPMGDLTGTVQAMAAMSSPELSFRYEGAHGCVVLEMKEIKEALGAMDCGVLRPKYFTAENRCYQTVCLTADVLEKKLNALRGA